MRNIPGRQIHFRPRPFHPDMRFTTRYLVVVALCLLPLSAASKCAYQWVYSPHETATPTGWLVVKAGGPYGDTLADAARRSPAVVSGSERVPLEVLAVHRGEVQVTQVVFRPTAPLATGRSWALSLSEPATTPPTGFDRVQWRVEPPSGTPQWLAAPASAGTSRQRFGCGPAVWMKVSVALSAPIRGVLVEVDGRPWLAVPRDGVIRLGHGMCSGPYRLTRGTRYDVRVVAAIGTDGARIPAPLHRLRITAP